MIVWYKITECWAYGKPRVDYIYFESSININDTTLAEGIEQIDEEYNNKYYWSDRWRGLEWEAVQGPPADWVESEIKLTEAKIQSCNRYLRLLDDYRETT